MEQEITLDLTREQAEFLTGLLAGDTTIEDAKLDAAGFSDIVEQLTEQLTT